MHTAARTTRIFINNTVAKFIRKSRMTEADLCSAVQRIEQGSIDADLGGGVFKQRIARSGGGKSGGFRTIILLRLADRALFTVAFAKNDQANITPQDLQRLRKLANEFFHYDDSEIDTLVQSGALHRICAEPQGLPQQDLGSRAPNG